MARRGKAHNRKTNIKRTASGRPSRSKHAKNQWAEMTEREALEVVMRQRMKAGIPERIARDQKCGTVQGWLYVTEQLDRDQYEAAEWFLVVRNEYRAAIDSPGAIWNRDDTRAASFDPDAYEAYCQRVRARWAEIERAVVEAVYAPGEKHDIPGALEILLIRQQLQGDLIGGLRYGLNSIHKVRVGDRKKAG